MLNSGVVDQDVDGTSGFLERVHRLAHGVMIRHVEDQPMHRGTSRTQGLGGLFKRDRVAAIQHDVGARVGQACGQGVSDALGLGGDMTLPVEAMTAKGAYAVGIIPIP